MEDSSNLVPVDDEEDDASRPAIRKKLKARKLRIEESETMENADDGSVERKKQYAKKYKPQWETLEVFANWLHRTPENLIELGKPEAYCVLCQQCLRAHKSDLMAHAKSKKHKDSENNSANTPRDCRTFIESYVPDIEDQAKRQHMYEASESSSKRNRGKLSKPIANNAAIIDQINAELEETVEKIKVCEEELNSLKVKKARLEFEFEYYDSN